MVGLIDEYAVVCRQWARAQRHAENGLRHWQLRCVALEAEVVRLRGRLLALRTALLWGLPLPLALTASTSAPPHGRSEVAGTESPGDAEGLLCRVGCQGHAHGALDGDGACRWHGTACGRLAGPVSTMQSIE